MKTFFGSRRRIAVLSMLILQIVFQAVGATCYSLFPDWLWALCDALIIAAPLAFGLIPGVICCLPNLIAELLWLIVKGYLGAFLHGVAFMTTVVALGLTERALWRRSMATPAACASRAALFELGLVLENLLYCLLRAAFIASKTSPVTVKAVLKTTLSAGNPVGLAFVIVVVMAACRKAPPKARAAA